MCTSPGLRRMVVGEWCAVSTIEAFSFVEMELLIPIRYTCDLLTVTINSQFSAVQLVSSSVIIAEDEHDDVDDDENDENDQKNEKQN